MSNVLHNFLGYTCHRERIEDHERLWGVPFGRTTHTTGTTVTRFTRPSQKLLSCTWKTVTTRVRWMLQEKLLRLTSSCMTQT